MGYCFMTLEKIKTFGQCIGKYKHNYREIEVGNADSSKSHLNEELVSLNGKDYKEALQDRLKEVGYFSTKKIRKNAVLGFEVVTTFSRENLKDVDIEKWKKDNVKWLKEAFNANSEKYGENVLSVMYHGDEVGNVHCHAFVVPIDDKGNLNARYYVQNRGKMIELQNSYAEKMKVHGLNRGVPGSKATHQDIKKFYTALNQNLSKNLPLKNPQESLDEYYIRMNEEYQKANLKNMGLEDKYKRLEMASEQELKNAISQTKKEFYEYKDKADILDELEREYGTVQEIKERCDEYEKLFLGIEAESDQDLKNNMIMLMNEYIDKGTIEKVKNMEKNR